MTRRQFRSRALCTTIAALVLMTVVGTAQAHPLDIDPSRPEPAVTPPPVVPGATADSVAARIWTGWSREPARGTTDASLAATEFDGRVNVFAKGLDGRIYVQAFAGTPGAWGGAWRKVPDGFGPSPSTASSGGRPSLSMRTDAAVAAAATTDRLFLVAKREGTPRLYLNVKSTGGDADRGWSGWGEEKLPAGASAVAPAAAATKTFAYVFRTGPDGGVYASRRHQVWGSWRSLDGPDTDLAPAAAADEDSGNVFVFRVAHSGEIYMNALEGSTWSSACQVNGGVLTDAAVAAARDRDALRLFHKGLDGRIYVQTLVDPHPYGDPCGYFSLPAEVRAGGITDAGMAAAYSKTQGRMFVLVKGMDDGIWYNVNTVLGSIHIQAIRVADSDGMGGCQAPVAGVSEERDRHVSRWLAYANKAFAPAFLRLAFDPDIDWAERCDTELNMDRPGLAHAMAVASEYPGKIVVFFRARSGGNGFSWWDPKSTNPWDRVNFVLMPGFDETTVCGHQNRAQLAHDLGHYLGLPHTFPDPAPGNHGTFSSVAAAKQWLIDGHTTDGDGFSDTPDDLGVVADPGKGCGPSPSIFTFRASRSLKATFEPPRTNVMSYYSDDVATWWTHPLVQTVTPQQTQRMYQTIAERGLLGSSATVVHIPGLFPLGARVD